MVRPQKEVPWINPYKSSNSSYTKRILTTSRATAMVRPQKEVPWINPYISSTSSYASPSRLLPCILLQSSSQSINTNGGSHNCIITFISYKRFGLVDTKEGLGKGYSTRKKVTSFKCHSWDCLL
jgi:hypothetical protein